MTADLEPKPPEILQNLKWLYLHGRRHWRQVGAAAVLVVGYLVVSSLLERNHGPSQAAAERRTAAPEPARGGEVVDGPRHERDRGPGDKDVRPPRSEPRKPGLDARITIPEGDEGREPAEPEPTDVSVDREACPSEVTGLAVELRGDGGNVTFARPLIGNRTTFTLEMWIKLWHPPVVGAPQPTRNMIYVESYVGGGPLNGCQRNFTFVSLDNGDIPDDEPGATVMVSWPNAAPVRYPCTRALPEGKWMHLAYARDGSALRIFVNGRLAAEGGARTYTGPEPSEYHLGLFVNPVSGNEWGRFVVDEVRVSSVARYSATFAPKVVFEPDADTLSLWHFDETSGAATEDASGNEQDAVLAAGAMRVTADR